MAAIGSMDAGGQDSLRLSVSEATTGATAAGRSVTMLMIFSAMCAGMTLALRLSHRPMIWAAHGLPVIA
jgi:hypothetical protein